MKLEITKEKETPLLSRKRITIMVEFEGSTPSRKDIVKAVAKKLDVSDKLIVTKHIYQRFGVGLIKVISHVYETESDKNKVEREYLLKKHVEAPKEEQTA